MKEGEKQTSTTKKKPKNLIPSHVLDELNAFCTRTFVIRFCEEEIELNDTCHFRTEFDAYPDYTTQAFFMEAELMYADPLNTMKSQVFFRI